MECVLCGVGTEAVVDLYNGDTLLHEVQAKAIETVDD